MSESAESVIEFWYSDDTRGRWFKPSNTFDQTIRQRFEGLWQHAREGQLDSWAQNPSGVLALVIVLDQFPRNMFRGGAEAWASDEQARRWCKHAIDEGFDELLDKAMRQFLYMPLMHSESLDDQDLGIEKFSGADLTAQVRFGQHHRTIIERFGRFPHRNVALGRKSSDAEQAYLDSPQGFAG